MEVTKKIVVSCTIFAVRPFPLKILWYYFSYDFYTFLDLIFKQSILLSTFTFSSVPSVSIVSCFLHLVHFCLLIFFARILSIFYCFGTFIFKNTEYILLTFGKNSRYFFKLQKLETSYVSCSLLIWSYDYPVSAINLWKKKKYPCNVL